MICCVRYPSSCLGKFDVVGRTFSSSFGNTNLLAPSLCMFTFMQLLLLSLSLSLSLFFFLPYFPLSLLAYLTPHICSFYILFDIHLLKLAIVWELQVFFPTPVNGCLVREWLGTIVMAFKSKSQGIYKLLHCNTLASRHSVLLHVFVQFQFWPGSWRLNQPQKPIKFSLSPIAQLDCWPPTCNVWKK